jgi:FkbM family methyltransferase
MAVPVVNPLQLLRRPEYRLHPGQAWRRVRRHSILRQDAVRLAWGLPVGIDPTSHIGVDILNLGVSDRVVPEVLLRLVVAGELAIDAGANIGQNTSIMALAAAPGGRVLSFEPSPDSLRLLTRNVERWKDYELAPIVIDPRGLSSSDGKATLYPSADLGGFSFESQTSPDVLLGRRDAAEGGSPLEVEVTHLDACVPDDARVGVLKIDVEGHEPSVLEGAQCLLEQGRIRDVVFEDYETQPSRAVRMLESYGYSVFAIAAGWRRPLVFDLDEWTRVRGSRPPNFVASLEPTRARARLARAGWSSLRVTARLRGPAG